MTPPRPGLRISFDLDDTLICYREKSLFEPLPPWYRRLGLMREPLRLGTRELWGQLAAQGHEIWIYTTSHRHPRSVKRWFAAHGLRVTRVVNGLEHQRKFGVASRPSKRPHVYGIDLHIDDSEGVAEEGEHHGFNVLVLDPLSEDWVALVLDTVKRLQERCFK